MGGEVMVEEVKVGLGVGDWCITLGVRYQSGEGGGVERAFTMPDSSLTELAELQNLRKLSLHAFCMARWYSLRSSWYEGKSTLSGNGVISCLLYTSDAADE